MLVRVTMNAKDTQLPVRFCVHSVDESLRCLLQDVLGELGLRITDATGADLVFTAYDETMPVARLVSEAISTTGARGAVVVLPFKDDGVARSAISGGALSTFTLGTSLARLEVAVGRALFLLGAGKVLA